MLQRNELKSNLITKLIYQKNPYLRVFFNINITMLIGFYLAGVFASYYIDNSYTSGALELVISIPIIISLVTYAPVFKSLSKYNTLILFNDKIIINNEKYSIDKITCSINNISKGSRIIISFWDSLILYDGKKKIGEFFFSIGTDNQLLNVTEESIKQVITDIKLKKEYDFSEYLKEEYQKKIDEKKVYNIGYFLFIGIFIIPAVIAYFIIVN